jgi:hypothetical protein
LTWLSLTSPGHCGVVVAGIALLHKKGDPIQHNDNGCLVTELNFAVTAFLPIACSLLSKAACLIGLLLHKKWPQHLSYRLVCVVYQVQFGYLIVRDAKLAFLQSLAALLVPLVSLSGDRG